MFCRELSGRLLLDFFRYILKKQYDSCYNLIKHIFLRVSSWYCSAATLAMFLSGGEEKND